MSSLEPANDQAKDRRTERRRVTHPDWCKPELCTAPEFYPSTPNTSSVEQPKHRSANLAAPGDFVFGAEVEVHIEQPVAPWRTSTWLVVNGAHVALDFYSPLLWAVVDRHAELVKEYPGIAEGARKQAMTRIGQKA